MLYFNATKCIFFFYKNTSKSHLYAAGIDFEELIFKLSQDRDAKSYQNIIAKLKEQDEDARVIAAEMGKRAKELFP